MEDLSEIRLPTLISIVHTLLSIVFLYKILISTWCHHHLPSSVFLSHNVFSIFFGIQLMFVKPNAMTNVFQGKKIATLSTGSSSSSMSLASTDIDGGIK